MRLSLIALAASVGLGSYLIADKGSPKAAPKAPTPVRSAKVAMPIAPTLEVDEDEAPELIEAELADELDEEMRGHEPITDREEFAMVFTVDGETFVQLSTEERASSRGTPRMSGENGENDEGVFSVIAPVATNAMPAEYRKWLGKSVLVDGECSSRVVGFAEVSRVTGEAGNPYEYDDEGNFEYKRPEWTIEAITDSNVTLAAKLDGNCRGTWARGESYSRAAIGDAIEAPELVAKATSDLLVDDPEIQDAWQNMGGEGRWQDAADIATHVYEHPLTKERWVFVQARKHGSCGDPSFEKMAAYRTREDGSLRRIDLDYGYEDIDQVVDLDGDGQPELILGRGDSSELVDLAGERHESIYVPNHHYGCGC